MRCRIELAVTEAEIDELGHVNNARFLDYFERGRMDWYGRCGPFLESVPGTALGTVVVNINVNYRKECFAGDRLVLTTEPAGRGTKSYVLWQRLVDLDDEPVADARVTSVVMDMEARKAIPVPEILAGCLVTGDDG